MNIETEMEWNSYMMKSGKVFGTYEFMIAKGRSWADINYVVWDVEDNTPMPLIKAASSALNTHPDILLKDVAQQTQAQQPQDMQSAINQQQVEAYNQRMQAQQNAKDSQGNPLNYNPQPTGKELMQAGKPGQAMVAGMKNLFTGGAHSRGGAIDAQAGSADGMKERYRLRDRLRPMRNLASYVQEGNDRRRQAKAGKSAMAAQRILDNEFAGMDPDNMSESERRRYDQQVALISQSNELSGGTEQSRRLNRTRQDRMKDKANADWAANSDPNKNPERPYPMRHQKVQAANNEGMGGAEEFGQGSLDGQQDPITDTEAAEVEEMGAGIDSAALDDSMPKPATDNPAAQTGGKPQADAGAETPAWHNAIPHKKGTARKGWISAITPLVADGKTPTKKELVAALKNKRKATGSEMSKKDIISAIMATFGNATPEVAEAIAEEAGVAEEAPELGQGEVEKPKKATSKKKKATPKKKKATETEFGQGEVPKTEEAPAEEEEEEAPAEEEEELDDDDNFLASYDETHAWDSLLKRLNVR